MFRLEGKKIGLGNVVSEITVLFKNYEEAKHFADFYEMFDYEIKKED